MTPADAAATVFYHGTRADLAPGDLIGPGYSSNYGAGKANPWVYFSAMLESAIWGCELAKAPADKPDARERIYIVAPTGEWFDDPNLTDKKFPGNPTKSYRSQAPLRVVGEVETWQGHSPEQLQAMRDGIAAAEAQGLGVID
jgi:rifampin ADP-ribosylating transferase